MAAVEIRGEGRNSSKINLFLVLESHILQHRESGSVREGWLLQHILVG